MFFNVAVFYKYIYNFAMKLKMSYLELVELIDILYTLDSASHPAGERKLKPNHKSSFMQSILGF
jgi:hypothetical protein